MAAISDAEVDAILAAAATGSPQIKPERVVDVEFPLASEITTLPPVPPMPRGSCSQRALLNGPSPEKGSGQDRFRQMMSGQAVGKAFPTPPTQYPQLPVLTPQVTQLTSTAGYYPTPMNATDGRAASVNPSRSDSMPNDTSSNASTNKGAFRTTYSSILSSECQSRHFNPSFTEWEGSPGKFYAKVRIQDHTITDARAYRNTMEAKQALAKQAIDWIRANLPKDGLPTRAAHEASVKQAQLNRERADRVRSNEFYYYDTGARSTHGNGLANGPANGYGSGGAPRQAQQDAEAVADRKKSDRQGLLEQIRSLYGHARGPSDAVLADPAAARAFLEGFALGERLRESAVRAERRRSRSPPKSGGGDNRRSGRDYRDRSVAARPDY
ncbi:hypothetical protein PG988_010360 [Apiospora saccharicola]